jgi:hypothetical protein
MPELGGFLFVLPLPAFVSGTLWRGGHGDSRFPFQILGISTRLIIGAQRVLWRRSLRRSGLAGGLPYFESVIVIDNLSNTVVTPTVWISAFMPPSLKRLTLTVVRVTHFHNSLYGFNSILHPQFVHVVLPEIG